MALVPAIGDPELLISADADAAVSQALASLSPLVRLNVWAGNPGTGQSFGHSRAWLGFYASREAVSGGQRLKLVRRIGARKGELIDEASVVMITTANGSRILYKHPCYTPLYDWSRAKVLPARADQGICIEAPLYGTLDCKLVAGYMQSDHDAAHFLRVMKTTDTSAAHETVPSSAETVRLSSS